MNKHAKFEEKDSYVDLFLLRKNAARLVYRIADG